jgi:uncharacterized protein (DUF2235 family)
MKKPTKRIALFFDGTANTPKDRTNVWRSYEACAEVDAKGVPQMKKYIRGVGTDTGAIVRGSIYGEGVIKKICEGYEWLVANYEKGTEVYVFGFSRGAFIARSLVQMVASCGLTCPEMLAEVGVKKVWARYEAISREQAHPIWRLRFFKETLPPGWKPSAADLDYLDPKRTRLIKIRMAGLWDTVGAIGADALKNAGALTQKSAMHNVRPTRAQQYGYHAVAIDEHRPMFDVTLWRAFVEDGQEEKKRAVYSKYYEQRWFVGAHSDVGGGYDDDRLPDFSLRWMTKKASALGLAFSAIPSPEPNAHLAPIHDSFRKFGFGVLTLWQKILPGDQRRYREIGRAPREVKTQAGAPGKLLAINETIDPSVLLRWKANPTYRPPNLVSYFERHPDADPSSSAAVRSR